MRSRAYHPARAGLLSARRWLNRPTGMADEQRVSDPSLPKWTIISGDVFLRLYGMFQITTRDVEGGSPGRVGLALWSAERGQIA